MNSPKLNKFSKKIYKQVFWVAILVKVNVSVTFSQLLQRLPLHVQQPEVRSNGYNLALTK